MRWQCSHTLTCFQNVERLNSRLFNRKSDIVSSEVFYFTITIQLLLTALTQVLTVYYRRTRATSPTSPNIQQLAYIGIYMAIFTNYIYTVQKALTKYMPGYVMFIMSSQVEGYTLLLGSL